MARAFASVFVVAEGSAASGAAFDEADGFGVRLLRSAFFATAAPPRFRGATLSCLVRSCNTGTADAAWAELELDLELELELELAKPVGAG